ncbi:MAG: hypothetical protein AB1428_02590 [Bacteroidota bacterium]
MKTLLLLLSSFSLYSCMHLGMMGTGDTHHSGGAAEMLNDPALEKEVTVGNVKAIALFPPLKSGEEVTLTLRLMDAETAAPISGAQVTLHAAYKHRLPGDGAPDDSTRQGQRGEHDIHLERDVPESATPGLYAITYGSSQTGEHVLMFHIRAIGKRQLEPEMTIEATRTIPAAIHTHQSGMMHETTTTTYVVVGAVVMGIVMIALMAGRTGMF